jgi:hypothetical protein
MILLNFAHPLTAVHRAALEQCVGQPIWRLVEVKTHFDHTQPFIEQARGAIDGIDLSPEQWQTTPLLINPPSLSVIACLVLAELHGRMGYFPPVLRLRPVPGSTPPAFEVAEIINLQAVRDAARTQR